jgi:hypothetical protein
VLYTLSWSLSKSASKVGPENKSEVRGRHSEERGNKFRLKVMCSAVPESVCVLMSVLYQNRSRRESDQISRMKGLGKVDDIVVATQELRLGKLMDTRSNRRMAC